MLSVCFTVALNYQNIKKDRLRIWKIQPFINQYNWKEIDVPSEQKYWQKFELNNKSIALNIVFVPCSTEKKDLHASQNIILSVKIKSFS